ncbi:MAG TPA: YrhB domain-containing protein [Actinomycetes bacterium]|jgi:hypothetical protein|nr:YrhB domain-containing protein [Actinomycetes bacterium]
MVDKRTATEIARRHLSEEYPGEEVVVDESDVLEEDWCWVFFYNTRAFYQTGELRESLVGNGPLIIEKATGALRVAGTAHPIEHYLAEHRLAEHRLAEHRERNQASD